MLYRMKKIAACMLAALCFSCGWGTARGAAEERDETPLLVLMYHQLLPKAKSKYIVDPEILEKDLALLKESGYASVTSSEVIDYVNAGGTLPEKPVLITFDDGHYNSWYYGKDILEKYGFTALISVIGRYSENSTVNGTGGHINYSYLTWEEIEKAAACGTFEIGNHSFDMHNYKPRFGAKQKQGESDEDYAIALKRDTEKLQNVLSEKCGVKPKVYAFPFGAYNSLTKQILSEEGFSMMLTCNEGVSIIKRGEPTCLYQVKRYNRGSAVDLKKIIKEQNVG